MDAHPPTVADYAGSDARDAKRRVQMLEARVAQLERTVAVLIGAMADKGTKGG